MGTMQVRILAASLVTKATCLHTVKCTTALDGVECGKSFAPSSRRVWVTYSSRLMRRRTDTSMGMKMP